MYKVFSVCCIFNGHRLVTASNVTASSASMFMPILASNCLTTNSQAGGHLTPTSYSSHYRLKTPFSNYSCSSLYSLSMGRTENISPNSSSIVTSQLSHGACRKHCFPVTPLLSVTNLLQPFPGNGRCLQPHYLATAVV
jgi:hypothetical protein